MTNKLGIERPLQNRVLPDGQIIASSMRGTMMGNRGGKIHDPASKTLLSHRWVSRRWISCTLKFKNRHREVMGNGYTELFFLDEVVALSAGHRPCFECQRKRANQFTEIWSKVYPFEPGSRADQMDMVLHKARTEGDHQTVSPSTLKRLPIGTIIGSTSHAHETKFFARHANGWLAFSHDGYHLPDKIDSKKMRLFTPTPVIKILDAGYQPTWHESAEFVSGATSIGAQ